MIFTIPLLALVLQVTSVLSASTDAAAVAHAALMEECGDLGVMTVPDGADPSAYRKCAAHPLGDDRRIYETSLAPPSIALLEKQKRTPFNMKGSDIFARKEQACYYDAGLGCTRNYCWKACGNAGDGKWCWTAAGDGGGAWLQCATYSDCDGTAACGKGCGPGNGSCGCSC